MANRHKAYKKGGGAMSRREDYTGTGEPDVVKEAKAKKSGGGVEMKAEGGRTRRRVHKARGGGVGADKHPFSSAYTASTEAK